MLWLSVDINALRFVSGININLSLRNVKKFQPVTESYIQNLF